MCIVIYLKKLKYNNIESMYIIIQYYFNNIHIMCILCRKKTIGLNIKNLDCSNCSAITSIPHIEGLQKLNCSGCLCIASIPHIQGLQELDCTDCPLITNIPHIQGLQQLNC